MASENRQNQLDRLAEPGVDHILGLVEADIVLVEYGSYGCPRCELANARVAALRDQFGDRLCYVFRHRPLTDNALARRAADMAECTDSEERYWEMHRTLMARGSSLTAQDLDDICDTVALPRQSSPAFQATFRKAQAKVDADLQSASASGVVLIPTFFINGRRYSGPWDDSSFDDALEGRLAHQVRAAALDFARWAPSTGILLVLASLLAVGLTNSPAGPAFSALWELEFGFTLGEASFRMSLLQWVNDGLLSLFFLTVGLEIKREFTVGHLSTRKSAALPIAAAIGGMLVPALLYRLVIPTGPWAHGWGVPMATDTAFAVALIVMLGNRVPIELRIFLTAAAIVDDIGSILVVALFYSDGFHLVFLAGAGVIIVMLAMLNRAGVYRVGPYAIAAIGLWACIHAGGLHATLAAVILALFIPTRPPANLGSLMAQVDAIARVESRSHPAGMGNQLSTPALHAVDAIHARLQSPAARMLSHVSPWSSYFVLPLFALANAGVAMSSGVWAEHSVLMGAVILGLVVGKPVGMVLVAALAVRLGIATKPPAYSWPQVVGAGILAGIGFTMSLFIAGQAFPAVDDFAAVKIAIFTASIVAAILGLFVLWHFAGDSANGESPDHDIE